jgi:putative flavoprotein involved in K+ transport
MTTDKADLVFASLPYRIMHEFQIPLYDQMRERDKDFYGRLEAAGFDHDWGDDGSGLFMKYLRRGSGYYIDTGAGDLVANGDVKLAKGQVDHVGKCWGLGSDTTKDPGPWEGEQRNMWKPTQQEALWFHGGNLHQSRHYSLYLALQLKARQAGIPTPVYGLQEVHHTG